MLAMTRKIGKPSEALDELEPVMTGGSMTDESKAMTEILYKEFQRISAKSAATDDWFFRFLSIAVVPFLAFLAYCLANPTYRIFVATLPFLSLIGLSVVVVLTTHYQYANSYGEYLTNRINAILGVEHLGKIRDAEFGRACYMGWHSPVTVSYVLGIGGLVFINVVAVPIINSTKDALKAKHSQQLGWADIVIDHYWPITVCCIIVTIAALLISYLRVQVLTRRLLARS